MTVTPTAEPVTYLREAEIRETIAEYVAAYEARDIDRLLTFYSDDAVFTFAPGTFRGKDAIRKVFEWDARLSPKAGVRDRGIGLLVSGRTAVAERTIFLTYEGIPYEEVGATIYEFDDDGLIRRQVSYYDKLALMHQIASRYPGIQGRALRWLTGYLVAQGSKGLDAP